MVLVPKSKSDPDVLNLVLGWIDVLAREDYDQFGRELGYWDQDGDEAVRWVKNALHSYRSPELFPNVELFKVTDWRSASGGNPDPKRSIVWYEPNVAGICAVVSIDLPLNEKWSDLLAEFLLFQRSALPNHYELRLEEITSWKQMARNAENDLR